MMGVEGLRYGRATYGLGRPCSYLACQCEGQFLDSAVVGGRAEDVPRRGLILSLTVLLVFQAAVPVGCLGRYAQASTLGIGASEGTAVPANVSVWPVLSQEVLGDRVAAAIDSSDSGPMGGGTQASGLVWMWFAR